MAENNAAQKETQLVVFQLASEEYGIDFAAVREILRTQAIARLPGTPGFVDGVIDVRGKAIPVLDMRKRLEVAVTEKTKESRIIVVDIGGQEVGMGVDAVTEVLRVPADSVELPSSVLTTSESAFLMGIVKVENRPIMLLDLDKLLSAAEERALLNAAVFSSVAPTEGKERKGRSWGRRLALRRAFQ
ncbi:MAG: chemotaxis protein CheW [Dehalococcoidia bacterium]